MSAADRLRQQQETQRLNQLAKRGSQRFVDQLPAAMLGAGDELLFGLPEFVANQIDREGVEKFKRENEGYGVGEVLGTVGSAFIPLGGLAGSGLSAAGKAIGAGAKAGGIAAKAGQALGAAGKFMQGGQAGQNLGRAIASSAGRGAIEGGLESALRAGFNERDILPEAIMGAGVGGVMGGVTGALGRSTEAIGEARKITRDAQLSQAGIDTKALRNTLKKSTMGSQGNRAMAPDQLKDQLSEFVKKNPNLLYGQQDDIVDALYQTNKQGYKALDKLYRENAGDIVSKTLQDVANAGEEISDIIMSTPNTIKQIELLGKRVGKSSTLAGKRSLLQEQITRNAPGTSGNAGNEAVYHAARIMKDSLDDQVSSLAEASGNKTLKELGQSWKMQEALGDATNRSNIKMPGSGTGSPTAEKTALQKMFGFGGTSGGITALGQDWSDPEKITGNLVAIGAAGITGAALAGALGAGKNALLGSMDDILLAAQKSPKLAKGIEKIAQAVRPVAAAVGRGGVGTVAAIDKAQEGLRKRENDEQEFDDQMAKPEQVAEGEDPRQSYMDLVQNRIYQKFAQAYPDYAQDEEAFGQFMEAAKKASNNFDPKRTAKLLFPREEDRKAYLAALQTSDSVRKTLPEVGEKDQGWLFGIGAKPLTVEQQGARGSLEGAFLEAAKLANVDAKTARAILGQIIDDRTLSKSQKQKAILDQARNWNETGYSALTDVGLGV